MLCCLWVLCETLLTAVRWDYICFSLLIYAFIFLTRWIINISMIGIYFFIIFLKLRWKISVMSVWKHHLRTHKMLLVTSQVGKGEEMGWSDIFATSHFQTAVRRIMRFPPTPRQFSFRETEIFQGHREGSPVAAALAAAQVAGGELRRWCELQQLANMKLKIARTKLLSATIGAQSGISPLRHHWNFDWKRRADFSFLYFLRDVKRWDSGRRLQPCVRSTAAWPCRHLTFAPPVRTLSPN